MIFVILGMPTSFLGLEKVRKKERKFTTKIALQQNSVKPYYGHGVRFTILKNTARIANAVQCHN